MVLKVKLAPYGSATPAMLSSLDVLCPSLMSSLLMSSSVSSEFMLEIFSFFA